MSPTASRRSLPVALLAFALVVLAAPPGLAICNVIPGAVGSFRGAIGSVNRPFAAPGDLVGIEVRPAVCDARSPGLDASAADSVVTVLFEPPQGPARAVVVASDCNALAARVSTCGAALGGAPASTRAVCVPAAGSGAVPGLQILDDGARRRLFFRFPDTDALFGGSDDDHTLAGPAKIVVTRPDAALPCNLARARCADATGVVACIDELFQIDGTCRTRAADVDATFPGFTALPVANDYQAVCSDTPGAPDGPCTGAAGEIRFTTDRAGNILLPWDYRGVLVRNGQVPVARLGLGSTSIAAFQGRGSALRIPNESFLSSFSPEGFRVPPLFTPLTDAQSGNTSLFGTIDAPQGVTRIARKGQATLSCSGGAKVGASCSTDAQCPGAECALFEFRDRYAEGGAGPVLLNQAAGGFVVRAGTPVPLDGINDTAQLFGFVLNEAIPSVGDLNLDGDASDFVVTLSSRATGAAQAIGRNAAVGRAVSRFTRRPFDFPAISAEGDVVAFLESEAREGGTDGNGDGDDGDAVLRAFRLGQPEDLLAGRNLSGLGFPIIDGRPLAISDGLLFHVAGENDGTRTKFLRASVRSDGAQASGRSASGSISATGRFVVFDSDASDLLPAGQDTNGAVDVFVRDRDTDQDGILDEPGAVSTVRVSVTSTGGQVAGVPDFGGSPAELIAGESPTISASGRHVSFISGSNQLLGPGQDTNNSWDVFVHDRDVDGDGIFDEYGQPGATRTVRVSVSSDAEPNNFNAIRNELSSDGRYVLFDSFANNLVPGDVNNAWDVFVHDRDADQDGIFDEQNGEGEIRTVRVSIRSDGTQPPGTGPAMDSFARSLALLRGFRTLFPSVHGSTMSANGRFVTFVGPGALVPHAIGPDCVNSTNQPTTCVAAYLHDRDADGDGIFDEPGAVETILASPPDPGVVSHGQTSPTGVTPDGRYVSLTTNVFTTLTADDTNNNPDVYVFDRVTRRLSRESVNVLGEQARSLSGFGALSADGRLIAFGSLASNLVGDDLGTIGDLFFRNRRSGFITRRPTPIDGFIASLDISRDLQTGVISAASPFLPSDTNDNEDVYLSALDPLDPINQARDLNGDGDVQDAVLGAVDLRTPGSLPLYFTAAEKVSVADGRAAFLRPEADVGGGADVSLNGDADLDDRVVQLFRGRGNNTVSNLGRAATELSLSGSLLAALISEAEQGGIDRNGDQDAKDAVLEIFDLQQNLWHATGIAADTVAARSSAFGSFVAVASPEADAGTDRTLDADTADRVVRLFDAGADELVPIVDGLGRDQPAQEFVLGDQVLALRSREADLCAGVTPATCASPPSCAITRCDLNADGDCCDDVLQAYDFATSALRNSRATVVPCELEACDPRTPYRVKANTVRFLTDEVKEGHDLNDDGDALDLLVQLFNLRDLTVTVIGQVERVPASSQTAGVSIDPLSDPPLDGASDNSVVFLTRGSCVEDRGRGCSNDAACGIGEYCDASAKRCKADEGTCRTGIASDCRPGASCVADFSVASARDVDGDELPDVLDNCPAVANAEQVDVDRDGVGDACDLAICGNGVVDEDPVTSAPLEDCDDGNLADGDACTRFCQAAGCFGDLDRDGAVTNADATRFGATQGCFPCAGPGCNAQCDGNGDGLVNNADALLLRGALGSGCPAPPADARLACGLGWELSCLLLPLVALRRARRAANVSSPRAPSAPWLR